LPIPLPSKRPDTKTRRAWICAERSDLFLDRHVSEQIRYAFFVWQPPILKSIWFPFSAIRLLREECKGGTKGQTGS
jgi:hypothetical protein